jgi:hypothetical protein
MCIGWPRQPVPRDFGGFPAQIIKPFDERVDSIDVGRPSDAEAMQ